MAQVHRSADSPSTKVPGTPKEAPRAVDPKSGGDSGIVIARNLVKVYDSGTVEVHALRGVDLLVHEGEMVAIMGPSGCGKTTLLYCLSGIDEMTSGQVFLDGHSLSEMSDNAKTDFRAMKLGFVFQSYNLLPVLKSVENVELPLLVAGRRSAEARVKGLEALELVGLQDEAMRKPAQLSGGQQQRVAIARAHVNDPAIVFADEPTGNLDSETTRDVMALIRRLNQERGETFVLVTHDAAVANFADRVVTMRSGRIEREYHPAPF